MTFFAQAIAAAGAEDETVLWVSPHYSFADVVLDIDGDQLRLTHEQASALAGALITATCMDIATIMALSDPPVILIGGQVASAEPATTEGRSD